MAVNLLLSAQHDNNRNIFIYVKRMSHLCIAEQTVGQVEQTKRGVRSAPPHHGRIRVYGTLPRLPSGNAAIFNVARSPGARVRPQTTDEDERARSRCGTCACGDTLPTYTVPGRAGSSQLLISAPHGPKGIDRNDWLKWEKLCQDQLRVEQYRDDVCRAVSNNPCLDKGRSKEKCCSVLRLRDALIMLYWSVLPCVGEIKAKGSCFLCTTLDFQHSGHLQLLHNIYVQYSTSVVGRWIEGDPQLHEEPGGLLLMNERCI